jgi:hypothetical protein
VGAVGNVVCLDGGLFPEPARPVAEPQERRTPGQIRRDRQIAAVQRGQHPLSVALRGPMPLHHDAARDLRASSGPTCGTCVYRKTYNPGHARSHPKCLAHPRPRTVRGHDGVERIATEFPRVSNGPGTDVAAAWPACIDYLEKGTPDGR